MHLSTYGKKATYPMQHICFTEKLYRKPVIRISQSGPPNAG